MRHWDLFNSFMLLLIHFVGGTLSYTLTYNDPIPTNAFVQFEYGDGTVSTAQALSNYITISGGSHTFQHTYGSDGDYITKFTISNLVSSVTVERQVLVMGTLLPSIQIH